MTQIDTASAEQQTPTRLVRANHRRRELNEAMTDLERVVAGPSSAAGWLDRVAAGLARVDEALRAHIDEVAGPDGLLAEILEVAPRLAGEARDDIGCDRNIRHRVACGGDQLAKGLRRGLARHPPQRGFAP